jgi:hypothetical protein
VQQEGCDLMMTGTRGVSGWKQFFVGSTAKRLIRKCPSAVCHDFRALVEKVEQQLPECRKVLYLSIKPSIKRWALAEQIQETNASIKTVCESNTRRLDKDPPPASGIKGNNSRKKSVGPFRYSMSSIAPRKRSSHCFQSTADIIAEAMEDN